MKNFILLGFWFLVMNGLSGQTRFQSSFSNGIYMCGNDIRLNDGYYYIGGTAKDALSSGFLILKTDNYGDSVWSREYRAPLPLEGKRIIPRNGFIYMIGNENPTTGQSRGFLAKSTESGEILWSKTFATAGNCEFNDAILKDDSTLVITGFLTGGGSGGKDILLAVFDTSGSCIWVKAYGKTGNESGNESGNAVIDISGTSFFLTGITDYNDPEGDIFILKLFSNGTPQWCRTYNIIRNGFTGQKAYDLIVNSNNQIVVSGNTKVFEFTSTDQVWNPLIIKTDSAGNVIYAKEDELNSGGGAAYQITVTSDGNFAISGYMRYCMGLLFKTDQLGATQWSKIYGWDQSGFSYSNQINSMVQQGNSFVMTGFVETQYDTSLYLIKANDVGETGCKETEAPLHADPNMDTPVVNDLLLTATTQIADLTDLTLTTMTPAPSKYTYCETTTGYKQPAAVHAIQPNPVKDFLQLTGFSYKVIFTIADALGHNVANGFGPLIDFSPYRPGVYFLTCCDMGSRYTYKVILMP